MSKQLFFGIVWPVLVFLAVVVGAFLIMLGIIFLVFKLSDKFFHFKSDNGCWWTIVAVCAALCAYVSLLAWFWPE